MMRNANIVLTRDRLEQHVWNYDFTGASNVIDVYIRHLRKKIDDGHEQKLIHTAVSYTHLDVYKRQVTYRVRSTQS